MTITYSALCRLLRKCSAVRHGSMASVPVIIGVTWLNDIFMEIHAANPGGEVFTIEFAKKDNLKATLNGARLTLRDSEGRAVELTLLAPMRQLVA